MPRAWRTVRRAAAQVYGPDGLGKLAKGGHPRRRLASAELLPEHERSAGAAGKESDRLAALRPASERRAAAERSAGRAEAEPGGVKLLQPFEALPAQGQGAGGAAGTGDGAAGARRARLREVGGLRGANEVALDMASMKGRGDSARGDAGRARLDAENPGKGGELRQGAGGRQQGAAVDASAVAGFTDARAASGGGAGAAAEKGGAGFAGGGGGAAGASAEAAACITDYNPVTPKEYQEVRAPAVWDPPPVETPAREPGAAPPRAHCRASSRRVMGAQGVRRASPPPASPAPYGAPGLPGRRLLTPHGAGLS